MQDLLTQAGHPIGVAMGLEHLAVGGLIAATLALGIAVGLKSRAAQVCALSVLIGVSACSWMHRAAVHHAYPVLRGGADPATADWVDIHLDRLDCYAPAMVSLGVVAFLALIVPIRRPRLSTPLAALALAAALACWIFAIHAAGASHAVRHPALRPAPPSGESLPLDGL